MSSTAVSTAEKCMHAYDCGYSGKRGFLSSLFHVSFSFLYLFVEEDYFSFQISKFSNIYITSATNEADANL